MDLPELKFSFATGDIFKCNYGEYNEPIKNKITDGKGGIVMKKLLLVGMVVLGAVSYGRDHEYRTRNEFVEVQKEYVENKEMLNRATPEEYDIIVTEERVNRETNMDNYSEFHRDLDNMGRGHENR